VLIWLKQKESLLLGD